MTTSPSLPNDRNDKTGGDSKATLKDSSALKATQYSEAKESTSATSASHEPKKIAPATESAKSAQAVPATALHAQTQTRSSVTSITPKTEKAEPTPQAQSTSQADAPTEWVSQAMSSLQEVDQTVKKWITERPLLVAAAAVGVGLGASLLVKKLNTRTATSREVTS